jgi:hypothetical protein
VFSMRSRNPDLVSVIERRIDEFAMGEVPEERTALERLAQVIEMFEARMRQGEDWTIAKKYVHSLLQRLAYARRSPSHHLFVASTLLHKNWSPLARLRPTL